MRIEFYIENGKLEWDLTINTISLITGEKSSVYKYTNDNLIKVIPDIDEEPINWDEVKTLNPEGKEIKKIELIPGNENNKRLEGFYINPEPIEKNKNTFPEVTTKSNILLWLLRAGVFNPLQKLVLRLNYSTELLLRYVLNNDKYFTINYCKFITKNKENINDYLKSKI